MENREFKGIWIPREVYESTQVAWSAKIIFLEIDSFTSKGKEAYFSNEYLAKFVGISTRAVTKHIAELMALGWIEQVRFDGRHRYLRSLFAHDFQAGWNLGSTLNRSQVPASSEEKFDAEASTLLENNTTTNTIKKGNIHPLATLLFSLIVQHDPKFHTPDLAKWSIHIDRLIRLDNRTPAEVEAVIRFAQADDFWHSNILSTEKLRKQYTKLLLKMNNVNKPRQRQSVNADSLARSIRIAQNIQSPRDGD